MAFDQNVVTVGGNLVADVQTRTTNSGKKVASFSIAHNHPSKNQDNKLVSFIRVEAWEDVAGVVGNGQKGDRVVVTGYLKQERWESDGKPRSEIKIVAAMASLTKKKGESAGRPQEEKSPGNDDDIPF